MNSSKDLSAKDKGDTCPMHDPAGDRYNGGSPALVKEYSKSDSELTNGLIPSVRKTGPLG